MGEADNCLENSERLSCEEGTTYAIYGPPKRPQTMRRSRMANMRENFLFLNSS